MALTVTVPAAVTALTTLAAVRDELGLSGASADATLARMIRHASDAIVTYCNRPFARQTYLETLPGYGDQLLMLSRTPIVSVASVTLDGDPIVDFTIEDADAGVLLRTRGWQWTAGVGWGLTGHVIPRSEQPRFSVAYVAGYLLPDQAGSTLPGDVERACIETVTTWYQLRQRDPGIQSERIGDLQTTYTTAEQSQLPSLAMRLLANWKRWA